MWFPFGDDGRIPVSPQRHRELTSKPLCPCLPQTFTEFGKVSAPPTYPPSSPNRVTMVDCAAPRLEWSRGIDFSKW